MLRITNLRLELKSDTAELKSAAAKRLKISENDIQSFRLIKKSVDARKKADIHFICAVELTTGRDTRVINRAKAKNTELAEEKKYIPVDGRELTSRPVVVGFGPAGMFAALIMAEAGQRPIVLERGKAVEERQSDVTAFWQSRRLNPESNVQFGEGGAGTFSDGKLTTGTKDPRISKVLEEFVLAGAPQEISYEAKPHIGTDRLPSVVRGIREKIISLGGEIFFECRMTGILTKDGGLKAVKYTDRSGSEQSLETENAVLACGHSARDIFQLFMDEGIPMESKAFSVGARIEHPAGFIDKAQYGSFAGHPALGTADYKFSAHLENGRGVYTFCMCPGGEVTGAASEQGHIVTNGMSRYRRDGENSNSALLVSVTPKDFGQGAMAGIAFQREIERLAFIRGGGDYSAPGQRVGDFLSGVKSTAFGAMKPSYRPGVSPGDISCCLPNFVVSSMAEGIGMLDKRLRGFAMADAVLTAPETRSSSPVRLLRDESRQSPELKGLYPCGEGAGYAGGIVSAAVDGIKTAEGILRDG